jgi:hypothetical protein
MHNSALRVNPTINPHSHQVKDFGCIFKVKM